MKGITVDNLKKSIPCAEECILKNLEIKEVFLKVMTPSLNK